MFISIYMYIYMYIYVYMYVCVCVTVSLRVDLYPSTLKPRTLSRIVDVQARSPLLRDVERLSQKIGGVYLTYLACILPRLKNYRYITRLIFNVPFLQTVVAWGHYPILGLSIFP